jgi:hypothetical protein
MFHWLIEYVFQYVAVPKLPRLKSVKFELFPHYFSWKCQQGLQILGTPATWMPQCNASSLSLSSGKHYGNFRVVSLLCSYSLLEAPSVRSRLSLRIQYSCLNPVISIIFPSIKIFLGVLLKCISPKGNTVEYLLSDLNRTRGWSGDWKVSIQKANDKDEGVCQLSV